jgi:hypothetical protein
VGTAGGTLVTVTGAALPASPTVRIGATATASVVLSSPTKLVVRVPARTADVYDVTISAAGTSQVLSRALTYVAAPVTPEGPADGGSGTPAPGGTPPAPGDAGPAPGDAAPAPGSTPPAAAPVVRTGPSGERLVRSAKFGALRSIWSMDCSSSCTGVTI